MCYCSGFKTAEFIVTLLRWYETDEDWLSPVQDKAIASPCEQCKCLSCFVEDGTCWLFRLFAVPNVLLQQWDVARERNVRNQRAISAGLSMNFLKPDREHGSQIGSNPWMKCCVYGQGFDFDAYPLMLILPERMDYSGKIDWIKAQYAVIQQTFRKYVAYYK